MTAEKEQTGAGQDEGQLARELDQLHQSVRKQLAAGDGKSSDERTSSEPPPWHGAAAGLGPLAGLLATIERVRREEVCAHRARATPADPADVSGREQPTWQADDTDPSPTARAGVGQRESVATPCLIGNFRILQVIGQGGHGLVYWAEDTRLQRDVAIKIPRPEAMLSPALRQRFLREGRAAASLSHPNILPVYEAGQQGPICYLATELVRGPDLAEWYQSQTDLDPRRIARIISQLAEAMEHAHQRGVWHRDLKPANILMSDDKPLVTDFGLAFHAGDESQQASTDSILGTPAFMSPEMASADRDNMGAGTDVYGLGGILYFLLCGRPPFSGNSALATLAAVRSQEPLHPRKLNPQLPLDLQSICLKCLEKEAERRYPSAHQLQLDLQRFLDDEPVAARPVSRSEQLIRWSRRNPRLSAALAAALFFLVAGLAAAGAGWQATSAALRRAKAASDAEEVARKKADERFQVAKRAVDQFYTHVAESRLLQIPGATPLRRALLEEALQYYTEFLDEVDDESLLAADMERAHFRMGEILAEIGRPRDALQHYRHSKQWLGQLDDITGDVASIRNKGNVTDGRMAGLLMNLGEPQEATATLEAAITDQQTLFAAFPQANVLDELAELVQLQAIHWREMRRPEAALESLRSVVAMREQLLAMEPQSGDYARALLASQGNLANALRGTGQIPESVVLYETIIATLRDLLAASDSTLADRTMLMKTLYNQAMASLSMSEMDRATKLLTDSCQLGEQLVLAFPNVEAHLADTAQSWSALAIACAESGDTKRAEMSFDKAAHWMKRTVDLAPDSIPNRLELAMCQLNRGAFVAKSGRDFDASRRHISDAMDLFLAVVERSPGSFHARMGLANGHTNLASVNLESGRFDDALAHAEAAMAKLAELQAEHQSNPQFRFSLSQTAFCRAKALEGLQRWEEAANAWEAALATAFPQVEVIHLIQRAAALARLERISEASEQFADIQSRSIQSPAEHFHAARYHALMAAARAEANQDAEFHIAECMAHLRAANKLNFFSDETQRRLLRDTTDFESLRTLSEFGELLGD